MEKEQTETPRERPVARSLLLWVLAVAITAACMVFQNRTGPTQPLEGETVVAGKDVRFLFLRSETIGNDLPVVLPAPVPEDVSGFVRFRRYASHDEWREVPLRPGSFEYARRGVTKTLEGLGATLPSLEERAGKYEYFVFLRAGGSEPVSVTGERPVYARYKAHVPVAALFAHILMIFASMILAVRTALEALVDGSFRWMIWASVGSLLLGAFVLGPLVQWYAFGVWWSGIPFGYDWTDNKVLVELAFWIPAVLLNLGKRRNRPSVILAGVVTLVVFFIPHSLFGSEYDYRTGGGRGTAG